MNVIVPEVLVLSSEVIGVVVANVTVPDVEVTEIV